MKHYHDDLGELADSEPEDGTFRLSIPWTYRVGQNTGRSRRHETLYWTQAGVWSPDPAQARIFTKRSSASFHRKVARSRTGVSMKKIKIEDVDE